MARADIALGCVLNFQVKCHNRLRVNSVADKPLALWDSRSICKALAHDHSVYFFLYSAEKPFEMKPCIKIASCTQS